MVTRAGRVDVFTSDVQTLYSGSKSRCLFMRLFLFSELLKVRQGINVDEYFERQGVI